MAVLMIPITSARLWVLRQGWHVLGLDGLLQKPSSPHYAQGRIWTQAPPRPRVVGGIRHVHKRFRVAALSLLLGAEVEV